MKYWLLNEGARFCYSPDDGMSGGAGQSDGGSDAGADGGDSAAADTGGADNTGGDDNSGADGGGDSSSGADSNDGAAGSDNGGADSGADNTAGKQDVGDDAGDSGQAAHFPEDWRDQMAGGDEKMLAALKRFNTPADFAKSYSSLNAKLSSGEYKKPLGDDATAEEIAAFRKDAGIPEASEGYLDGLPDGIVFGDDDQAVLQPFLEDMHGQNASPAMVQSALNAYHSAQAHQVELIQDRDLQIQSDTEDVLRKEWGVDYRQNIAASENFLTKFFPADVIADLNSARLGDETMTPIMSSPHMVKAFAQLGRQLNPNNTVTNGSGLDAKSINDQINDIETKEIGKGNWYKDESRQKEYRALLNLRDTMAG